MAFPFLISFFLVAFGQCAWIREAGVIAAMGGYALFWMAMLQLPQKKSRFFLAMSWFIAVQAVQLSWMTSTFYMGLMILGVYFFLLVALGVQFAFLSSMLSPASMNKPITQVAIAGGFVILEWARIYFLTGFTWNPVGLALASSRYSLQLAAVFGIYGLTFWVILTNLAALSLVLYPTVKRAFYWAFLALFPYGFGIGHEAIIQKCHAPTTYFTAALINTGIRVEEKNKTFESPVAFIPPHQQWERVMSWLSGHEPVHFIILPEAAFPFGNNPFYPLDLFQKKWENYFGEESAKDFPSLTPPFAHLHESTWFVSNAFFLQSLANHFSADLIAGLDDSNAMQRYTNTAFLFRPFSEQVERYDKRILAPVGEYVPLQKIRWVADFFEKKFGIKDSFDAGKEAKVFQSHVSIGVPICLEEIYSGLVRDLRNRGAELFVGLSNDVWFPDSRLGKQHFEHARIRAAENGVFFLRSSNMGITGGIDCFGQPICTKEKQGALFVSFPAFSYATLYSFWGDAAILFISGLSVLLEAVYKLRFRQKRSL
ncbi:MAG TPA: apolipoprotein N-acyltransferase [Chlamydiales bacterium]|nr:apolipoprotein N-acyltransferase [Chlamydiales bacterium]